MCACVHICGHVLHICVPTCMCAYVHSQARPFRVKQLLYGRDVLQCSAVILEAQLFLANDKEGMACAGLAKSCCSATFLWLFFLDTASQKGSERAARSKPAGSICGDKPSRLGVQALNPKLWVSNVEPGMGLVSGCQEDVLRSQSVSQDGGGELGTPASYTQQC